MNTGNLLDTGIIVRMDSDLYTRRWAKALVAEKNKFRTVEAIAVKASIED